MSRSRLVAYWVTTGWVALGMVSAGVAQVLHVPANVDGFVGLGYPLHFVTLLGILVQADALAHVEERGLRTVTPVSYNLT